MATFTVKLSDLLQEGFDLRMGPDDYPIFDESYREGLNKKILEHYWNYEIGQETESMFCFSLNRKMREIMPYYNQLYKSTQIEFDPLQTVNYTDFSDTSNTQEDTAANTTEDIETSAGTTTSTTLGKSRSVSSTTPQVQLSGNEDYASSAADVNSSSDVTGDSSGNTTANSTTNLSHTGNGTGTIQREVKGSQGIASELLMTYRATFLNIDMEIIRNLEPLFMQIWDNGDEYSNSTFVMNWGFGYGTGIL